MVIARRTSLIRALGAGFLFLAVTAPHAQPTAPRLRLVEEVRIDGAKEEFSVPSGFLMAGPGGRMAFADFPGFHVRFYAADGKGLVKFGRQGSGPGEFSSVGYRGGQRANFDGGTVGDTIWLFENNARRLTYVSWEGKFLRTVNFMPLAASAATASPRVTGFYPRAVYADGSMLGPATIVATGSVPSAAPATTDMIVVSPHGDSYRSVAKMPPEGEFITVTDPRSGRPDRFHVFFTPGVSQAVSRDGSRFAFVTVQATSKTGGTFTLTVLSPKGDTLLARKYPLAGIPLAPGEADQMLAELEHDMKAPMGNGQPAFDPGMTKDVLSRMRAAMPPVKLAVGQVLIGIDNSIWLSLATGPKERAWFVFDEKGNPLGQLVHMPASGANLQSASKTSAWFMEYDSDAVPSIVRYRVTK